VRLAPARRQFLHDRLSAGGSPAAAGAARPAAPA
jgi:hypothetical protein